MATIDLRQGNCLDLLARMPAQSVDMIITSPPYYNLRDYGSVDQIGAENSMGEYIDNLLRVFTEAYRVLKDTGSCWVNIADVYDNHSLLCIPDRFKIRMCEAGWLCRNEIIWHKPNAMPSSAKTRFNNDFEKLFFFVKKRKYYFLTQYEPLKSTVPKKSASAKPSESKYQSYEQESTVRQGMNKSRGCNVIALRKNLPSQQEFVSFMRNHSSVNAIDDATELKRTKIEHWFRMDDSGFAFPSAEDWNAIKSLLDDGSEDFRRIDSQLTDITYETDDILKNVETGRVKRAVWSINTKPFKGYHYAPYPEALVETPILACCPADGVVLDPFMGSGTTGVVCQRLGRNFIGMELNADFVEIARDRISEAIHR